MGKPLQGITPQVAKAWNVAMSAYMEAHPVKDNTRYGYYSSYSSRYDRFDTYYDDPPIVESDPGAIVLRNVPRLSGGQLHFIDIPESRYE